MEKKGASQPKLTKPELPPEHDLERHKESQRHNESLGEDQQANPEVFNENDVQNLKDIFQLFDKEERGRISGEDLEAVLNSLKRDPEEARAILGEVGEEGVSFEQFLDLMQKIEQQIERKEEELASERAHTERSKMEERTTYI